MATKVISRALTGDEITLFVETDLVAPYSYLWKKNGALIPGAPSAKTYTPPPLRPEDIRAKYSIVVLGQDKMEESDAIVIDAKMKDSVTIPNQGLPKPAWQPYVDPDVKGKI